MKPIEKLLSEKNINVSNTESNRSLIPLVQMYYSELITNFKSLNDVQTFDKVVENNEDEDVNKLIQSYHEDLVDKIKSIREIRPLSKVLSKRNIQEDESNKAIMNVVNSYYDGLVNKVIKLKEIKPLDNVRAETLDTNLHSKSCGSILNTIQSYYDGLVDKIQDQYSRDRENLKTTYSQLSDKETDAKACDDFKNEIYNRACRIEDITKRSMDNEVEDFSRNFFDYLLDKVNLQTESEYRAITEMTEENNHNINIKENYEFNDPIYISYEAPEAKTNKKSEIFRQSDSKCSESVEEAKAVAFSFFGELISHLNLESSVSSNEKKQDNLKPYIENNYDRILEEVKSEADKSSVNQAENYLSYLVDKALNINQVVDKVITEPAIENELRVKNQSVIVNTLSNGIDDLSVFEQKKLSAYDDLSNTGRYDFSKRNQSMISSNTERVNTLGENRSKKTFEKNYHPEIQEEESECKIFTPPEKFEQTPQKETEKKISSRGNLMLKSNSSSNNKIYGHNVDNSSGQINPIQRRSFNLKKNPPNTVNSKLNLRIKDATPEKKPSNILRSSSNAMRKMNEKIQESERRVSVDFLESDEEGKKINRKGSKNDIMKKKIPLKNLLETDLCIDDVSIKSGRRK